MPKPFMIRCEIRRPECLPQAEQDTKELINSHLQFDSAAELRPAGVVAAFLGLTLEMDAVTNAR